MPAVFHIHFNSFTVHPLCHTTQHAKPDQLVLLLNFTERNPAQISGGTQAILTKGWRETEIISRVGHNGFLMFVSSSSYQDAA